MACEIIREKSYKDTDFHGKTFNFVVGGRRFSGLSGPRTVLLGDF
jgi:hypothetical protein